MNKERVFGSALLACVYVVTAILFLFLGFSDQLMVVALAAPLIWLSIVDVERAEVPDLATLMVVLIGLPLVNGGVSAVCVRAAEGIAVALAFGALGHIAWTRTGREWLGLGDAKLIGAGTFIVGADLLWIVLTLACSGGISMVLFRLGRGGGRDVPFGPFLAYSIFITRLIAGPSP